MDSVPFTFVKAQPQDIALMEKWIEGWHADSESKQFGLPGANRSMIMQWGDKALRMVFDGSYKRSWGFGSYTHHPELGGGEFELESPFQIFTMEVR